MDPIQAGYRALNGYVFSAAQAEAFNRAAARARQSPTEENLNGAHHLFVTIITTPASDCAAYLERRIFWQRHALDNAQTIEQEARARDAIARLEEELEKENTRAALADATRHHHQTSQEA